MALDCLPCFVCGCSKLPIVVALNTCLKHMCECSVQKQLATMRNVKLFVVNSTQVLRPGVAMYAGVLGAGVGLGLIVQWAAGGGCLDAV